MIRFALVTIVAFIFTSAFSQSSSVDTSKQNAYIRAINQRADKIVNTLGVSDSKKALIVRDIIAGQYKNLNDIQTDRDKKIAEVKLQLANDKDAKAAAIKKLEDAAAARVDSLHAKYVSALATRLSSEQVVKVKDGMTYNVLPITYNGYQQMILNLTDEQKKQIMAWLVEAREHAMDAETSDKKHAWFGKYKGKINNYLSAAGIDMNKAGKEWQERIKAQQTANKN
ncbi:MAG TPA: DUF3826 domain-containing protein [Segetibacter sp.]|nr:DUF3826 domain-containing protein [Segetibacter sp.]